MKRLLCALLLVPFAALGQSYPAKPVRAAPDQPIRDDGIKVE